MKTFKKSREGNFYFLKLKNFFYKNLKFLIPCPLPCLPYLPLIQNLNILYCMNYYVMMVNEDGERGGQAGS